MALLMIFLIKDTSMFKKWQKMPECGSWVKKYEHAKECSDIAAFRATMFQSPRRKKNKENCGKNMYGQTKSLRRKREPAGHMSGCENSDTVAVSLSGIAPHPVVACADTTFGGGHMEYASFAYQVRETSGAGS